MSEKPCIAMVGMASENCTFSSGITRMNDFEVLRGVAQMGRYPFLQKGDDGLAFNASGDGGMVAFIPVLHARALPGGVIEAATYASLKEEILAGLEALLPLDAVYLDLHGAMHVAGLDDAEADLVGAIRHLVGESCLLGASMDLHGNVSETLVRTVDLFSAYRTAPHLDEEATREKVCGLLSRCLCEGIRPTRAWVPIPVLLPGEMTSTLDEPGQSLYAGLSSFDARPGVLDVSLWVGYVWADEPRCHACVLVTGTGEVDSLQSIAEEVAQRYWDQREQFRFNVPHGSMNECVGWAIADQVKPVVISDSGDNPTAGGVGNLPLALRYLVSREVLMHGKKTAIVAGIWDEEAVRQCVASGVDAELELVIGSTSDPRHCEPLRIVGTVERFVDNDPVAGRQVVFRIGKGIQVVLTERRKPFHYFPEFHLLHLKPEQSDIVVVKMGYLVPDLQKLASKAYLALTDGAVNQHVERVEYAQISRPMFPFDRDFAWSPEVLLFRS